MRFSLGKKKWLAKERERGGEPAMEVAIVFTRALGISSLALLPQNGRLCWGAGQGSRLFFHLSRWQLLGFFVIPGCDWRGSCQLSW